MLCSLTVFGRNKIEVMIGGSTQWILIDSMTSTRYKHEGQTPGKTIVYQMTASRAKRSSVAVGER